MESIKYNKIENKENIELENKHKSWMKNTAEGIGLVVGGGLVSYVVLEKLGLHIPSYLIAAMIGGAHYYYKGNNKEN
ncbi:MAG: hypothetical protein WCO35_02295 [Candidatus Nomurabacteria bacterium]